MTVAARHKLRGANGAGVGSLHFKGIQTLFPGQEQKIFELIAEILGAMLFAKGEIG